jgi:hypothetical protein
MNMIFTQEAVDARIKKLEGALEEEARRSHEFYQKYPDDSDYPRRDPMWIHRAHLELKLLRAGVTNYVPHADGFLIDGRLLITTNHKYRRLPKYEWKYIYGFMEDFIEAYIKPYHQCDVNEVDMFKFHHQKMQAQESWVRNKSTYIYDL